MGEGWVSLAAPIERASVVGPINQQRFFLYCSEAAACGKESSARAGTRAPSRIGPGVCAEKERPWRRAGEDDAVTLVWMVILIK